MASVGHGKQLRKTDLDSTALAAAVAHGEMACAWFLCSVGDGTLSDLRVVLRPGGAPDPSCLDLHGMDSGNAWLKAQNDGSKRARAGKPLVHFRPSDEVDSWKREGCARPHVKGFSRCWRARRSTRMALARPQTIWIIHGSVAHVCA